MGAPSAGGHPVTWVSVPDLEPAAEPAPTVGYGENSEPVALEEASFGFGTMTQRQGSLSDSGLAASDTPATAPMPGAPPPMIPGGELSSAQLEAETESEPEPWRLHLESSMTWWRYDPVSARPDDAVWVNVTTEEEYVIEPINMLRIAGRLRAEWADISLAYETDQGMDVIDTSSLLDVALSLSGLEGLTFKLTTLDFQSGHVRLKRREDDSTIQTADFSVLMTLAELRYQPVEWLYLFGRYTDYALPRNIYLRENRGTEEEPSWYYHQISEQLVRVDTETVTVGVGVQGRFGDERGGRVVVGGYTGLGFGPYRLTTLNAGDRLDDGWLAEVKLGAHLDLRQHIAGPLSAGLGGSFTFFVLGPLGLPDKIQRDLEREGIDTTNYSLSFGTFEVLTQGQVYLSLDF